MHCDLICNMCAKLLPPARLRAKRCDECHLKAHADRQPKLNAEQEAMLRKLAGTIPKHELAKRMGVSRNLINFYAAYYKVSVTMPARSRYKRESDLTPEQKRQALTRMGLVRGSTIARELGVPYQDLVRFFYEEGMSISVQRGSVESAAPKASERVSAETLALLRKYGTFVPKGQLGRMVGLGWRKLNQVALAYGIDIAYRDDGRPL